MIQKLLFHIITFLFSIFAFSGCASFIKKTFIKPKISYESMFVEKIDPAGATIRLYLGIENKNNLDFTLSHMNHIIFIEDKQLLETTIDDKVYIKARDKTIVEFPLQISFLDLQDNLAVLWKKKKLKYNINSKITLDTAIGEMPFDVKYEDFLELPPLPDIQVENIKMQSMTFSEIDMTIFLKILNNDKIQLNVEDLHYKISFNNFEIAKGTMQPASLEPDKNDLEIAIPVRMKLLSLKRSITDMFKKGEIQYDIQLNIKGKSAYGEYVLPLDKTGITKIY